MGLGSMREGCWKRSPGYITVVSSERVPMGRKSVRGGCKTWPPGSTAVVPSQRVSMEQEEVYPKGQGGSALGRVAVVLYEQGGRLRVSGRSTRREGFPLRDSIGAECRKGLLAEARVRALRVGERGAGE